MAKRLKATSTYRPMDFGAKCKECPLNNEVPTPPEHNPFSEMTVLLESPGEWETLKQRPAIGPTGEFLNEALEHIGSSREQVDIINTTACILRKNLTPSEKQQAIDCCKPRLLHDIEKSKHRTVAACGIYAAKAFLPVSSLRLCVGSKFEIDGRRFFFNYHPTFAGYREPALRPLFGTFLLRAWQDSQQIEPAFVWPRFILTPNKNALNYLTTIKENRRRVGFDVESQGVDPLASKVMCLGISQNDVAISLPWDSYYSERYGAVPGLADYPLGPTIRALVKDILENNPTVTHNGQHDVLCMRQYDIKVNYTHDTLISHAVLAPQLHGYRGLQPVAIYELNGIPRWKDEFHQNKEDLKGSEHFVEERATSLRLYNAKDSWAGEQASYAHDKRLEQLFNGDELLAMKMGQSRIAMKMREIGIKRCPKRLKAHSKKLRKRISDYKYRLRTLIRSIDWPPPNLEGLSTVEKAALIVLHKETTKFLKPTSPIQTKYLFFTLLGIKPIRWSEKTNQPSLDDSTLDYIITKGGHPADKIAHMLTRYRQFHKLYTTYVKKDTADKNDVIHAEPKVYGTKTNRWSYKNPNLQTIPKPVVALQKNGKKKVVAPGLRDIFVARDGKTIVEADYSRLELWILAVLSGDRRLLEMKRLGLDAHTENCKDLFLTPRNLTYDPSRHKHLRSKAKTFVFNVNYGPEDHYKLAEGVWNQMKKEDPSIQLNFVYQLVKHWFEVHPEIHEYRCRVFEEAKERGYSQEPVWGLQRHYYGFVKDTESYNFEMQSVGAGLIGRAIIAIDKEIDWDDDVLLLQVHDALIGESTNPYRFASILKKHMEAPITINGEQHIFPVDYKVGPSWGEAKEYETLEEIAKEYGKC